MYCTQNDDAERQIGNFRIHWDTTIIEMKAAAAKEKDEISRKLKLKQLEIETQKILLEDKSRGTASVISCVHNCELGRINHGARGARSPSPAPVGGSRLAKCINKKKERKKDEENMERKKERKKKKLRLPRLLALFVHKSKTSYNDVLYCYRIISHAMSKKSFHH